MLKTGSFAIAFLNEAVAPFVPGKCQDPLREQAE
jgi:hypothetical protein